MATGVKPDEPVRMGEIVGLFGVRGWVKVFSHTRPRAAILGYDPWLLKIDGQWQPVHLVDSNGSGNSVRARLEGYQDRDQAAVLVGKEIAILPDQLQPLKEGEYYWSQLVGLQVINQTGVVLGVVDRLIETGANDVLVVIDGERERMLPYIPDVVKQVKLDDRILEVEWDPDF